MSHGHLPTVHPGEAGVGWAQQGWVEKGLWARGTKP